MIDQFRLTVATLCLSVAPADVLARPHRHRRRGELGIEVLQMVILGAAFAAICLAAAAIFKRAVIDSANSIQTH